MEADPREAPALVGVLDLEQIAHEDDLERAEAMLDKGLLGTYRGEPIAEDYQTWLEAMYPEHVSAPMGDHHREVWEWADAIESDSEPDPIVAPFARGGGKSSTAELLAAKLGLTGKRSYIWYVRDTQDRADDSVGNIAALLEAKTVEKHYPKHAQRELSKYGHSKGWNSTRLRTRGKLVVDAIGLDTARRGLKIEEKRPDLIILDDLDGLHDTGDATKKKISTLTKSILPAGTARTAVVGIQNLIIPNGIFTQIVDGRADYLMTARVIGPVPAIEGMVTEVRESNGRKRAVIVGGEPTWEGQGISECQRLMDRIGLRAFEQECQHNVHERIGALWKLDEIMRRSALPEGVTLVRVVVGVDPSGGGDAIGILVVGLGSDGRGYVLADYTVPGSAGPLAWGTKAVAAYDDFNAGRIVAESNFGGNLVESNILASAGKRRLPVTLVHASRGKAIRAEPVAALYEKGLVDHVGPLSELESEMVQWVPGDKTSPNRLDALVWGLTFLMLGDRPDVQAWYPGMDEEEEAA
jgi:hypothetical protein